MDALAGDRPLDAPVSNRDRALLRYALKLTRDPASVAEADIESLREVGFEDRAIHDACQVIAYFAYVNRVADGLGVELEIQGGRGPGVQGVQFPGGEGSRG